MERSDRRVITRSPSHAVHAVCAGGLLGAHVEAESRLEADFIRRAALIPSRPHIIHQPFKIAVSPKGYTPDFLLFFPASGFKTVVEVKLAERITPEVAELFDRAAKFLRPRGYIFFVINEFELKKERVHRRAKLLTRYAKEVVPTEVRERIQGVLANRPAGAPIGTVARQAGAAYHQILSLIAHGTLFTGPRLQTDPSAVVSLYTPEENDDEILFSRWFSAAPWDADV